MDNRQKAKELLKPPYHIGIKGGKDYCRILQKCSAIPFDDKFSEETGQYYIYYADSEETAAQKAVDVQALAALESEPELRPACLWCGEYHKGECEPCKSEPVEPSEFTKRLRDEALQLQLYDSADSRRCDICYSDIFKALDIIDRQARRTAKLEKGITCGIELIQATHNAADSVTAKFGGPKLPTSDIEFFKWLLKSD